MSQPEEEEEQEEDDEVQFTQSEFLEIIENTRNFMMENKVTYEPALYTSKLRPEETKFLKMYLMTVGSIANAEPAKNVKRRKTLGAYVGASRSSTVLRIHQHNNIGVKHKNPRTRTGASNWTLCMILFIPNTLREYVSSKVIHRYWDAAHGKGKINRGLFLQQFLGLPCFIPENLKDIVNKQKEKFKMPSFIEYDFKPERIIVGEEDKKIIQY